MLFLCKHKAVVGALLALFFVLIFPGNLNQYFYHIDSFGLNTDTATSYPTILPASTDSMGIVVYWWLAGLQGVDVEIKKISRKD